MRTVDELRPLTAGRLLELWRDSRGIEDPLERVMLCNVRILAECCYFRGEPAYSGEAEALEDLTAREIEQLLRRLSEGGGGGLRLGDGLRPEDGGANPEFDAARFEALREE